MGSEKGFKLIDCDIGTAILCQMHNLSLFQNCKEQMQDIDFYLLIRYYLDLAMHSRTEDPVLPKGLAIQNLVEVVQVVSCK